jgi:hypothetical protein
MISRVFMVAPDFSILTRACVIRPMLSYLIQIRIVLTNSSYSISPDSGHTRIR